MAGYSFGRIWEELLRVDPAHHILGLRLNFFVAIVLFAIGIAWFVRTQRKGPDYDAEPYPERRQAAPVAGR